MALNNIETGMGGTKDVVERMGFTILTKIVNLVRLIVSFVPPNASFNNKAVYETPFPIEIGHC